MFLVEWIPSASNELAALWIDHAAQRQAINQATEQIDSLLHYRPEDAGESRSEGRRILLAAPLGIVFKVEPDQNKVRVLKVWHYKKRAGGR